MVKKEKENWRKGLLGFHQVRIDRNPIGEGTPRDLSTFSEEHNGSWVTKG